MKKLIIFVLTLILAMSFCNASFASSIRDRGEYRASSDLTLGALDAAKGYQMPDQYQLNLEYQSPIPNSVIEAFNDYFLDQTPPQLNFPDGEYYYLKINCAGHLPIGIWDFISIPMQQLYAPDSGEDWVQWTLSYYEGNYFQTILAGDILNCDGPNTFLRVRPTTGYRSFVDGGAANYVEVFNGATVNCEVIGYLSPVSCENMTTGTVLTAELVPEPATMFFLAIGTLAFLRKK